MDPFVHFVETVGLSNGRFIRSCDGKNICAQFPTDISLSAFYALVADVLEPRTFADAAVV